MKYRHHFHAGNFADFWKHLLWHWSLTYLQKNPAPINIVDTHSGMGFYLLDELSEEFHEGIDLFCKNPEFLKTNAAPYHQILQRFAQSEILPGSPLLAQTIKRDCDELWLFENNEEVCQHLSSIKKNAPATHIKHCDGLNALIDLLHRPLKRMAILIDPVYERPEEYAEIAEILTLIHAKKPQALVALWYPIGKRAALMRPIWEKMTLWPEKSLNVIYEKKRTMLDGGLQASGMLILNPPYLLKDWVEAISPLVSQSLHLETYTNLSMRDISQKFDISLKR